MRTTMFALAASVLFCCSAAPVHADGLLYQLPDDGAWVLFDIKGELTSGADKRQYTGSLRMSSVGKVTEDERVCRWIEFELTMNNDGRENVIVAKLLVPESELTTGKKSIGNRARGYVQLGSNIEAVPLTDENIGPLPAFLADPLADVRQLEDEVVTSKLGKLSCQGLSGFVEFDEGTATNKASFVTRRHAKAPFGVVTSDLTLEVRRGGVVTNSVTMPLRLSDFGFDAKTKLPEHK